MAGKKRSSGSIEEVETEKEIPSEPLKDAITAENNLQSIKPMERLKKRKAMDKEKHQNDSKSKGESKKVNDTPVPSSSTTVSFSSLPGLHIGVFNDLSSADASVREAAAEKLATELIEVQRVYESIGGKEEEEEEGVCQLEAEKDDGLENCAPSLRYAIRRLIRGVSSPREVCSLSKALSYYRLFQLNC